MQPPLDSKENPDHPIHGLVRTMRSTVQYLEGSWQFQIFNNLDELKQYVPLDQQQQFVELLETMVKKPLRRQIGRLSSIKRSLDELTRYLS
jgi:hypothetical protein